jgi:diguanylate cyclase (GGDEF)-like protein/PAS domain S-box-containing protein
MASHDQPPPTGATSTAAPPSPVGWHRRFADRHLFDYNAQATRRWLAIVIAGAVAGIAALVLLALDPAVRWGAVAATVALVVMLANFPLQIPRTKYSISVADVFLFALLALHGVEAAVVAAGIEGAIGAYRSSKRLTSRLGTPAAAMATMAVCGHAFEWLQRALMASGVGPGPAMLASLSAVALPYFAGITLPLMAVIAAKNGQRVSLSDWGGNYGWLGAVYLVSAGVAAILTINARQFGLELLGVSAALAIAVLVLARLSLQHREREHAAQEARIGDAQREAAFNQQRFLAAFMNAAIGMAIVRPDGHIHQVNHALCRLLGQADEQLTGTPFRNLLHAADVDLFMRHQQPAEVAAAGPRSLELRCRHADDSEIWVAMHFSPFIDPAQERTGMIYQLHDITTRRQAEGKLQHIAYHDGLTDLANRNCFQERLRVVVERQGRDPASAMFAVLFLDLDRFKIVNDSLGHAAGNQLLREVALRLRRCVRPNDLVARLGGDEFTILLDNLGETADAQALAQRVLDALAVPVSLNGTEVIPGASLGMTFSDLGHRGADEILRDADLAMYEAKAAGRGRVVLFDQSMHDRVAQRLALESDLRHAVGDGKLTLNFQPIYQLDPHRLSGFEALVRWVHPVRGPVSPAVFVTLAEESEIIESLSRWVIDEAVCQLAAWHRSVPHMAHLTVNVNISGRDLARADLPDYVFGVLEKHGLPPERLTLEITETTLMARLDVALRTLEQLRARGVRFSIDDFGTGYSSLAYLSTLPIDSLKIDRSFVMGLHERPQNVEIVRAVLTLGKALGRKVVAEGIETPEQLATLRGLGVHFGQGYLLSRPLSVDKVPELLYLSSLHLVPAAEPAALAQAA